jgi:23S rRNA pseudouridine1911/1915/1917 synthase
MPAEDEFSILVNHCDQGKRLDVVVASNLPACSRSRAAQLIAGRHVVVDGQSKKPGYRVRSGDRIHGTIPPAEPLDIVPEPLSLNILYEDSHLVVVNKPPGLVVHPAPGHYTGTLVHALLYHFPDLCDIGGKQRPGIVHRLDKDTSGVMVVAKTGAAHEGVAQQFKSRQIRKEYVALVYGEMPAASGRIDLSIGRHPTDRKRMCAGSPKGREAETAWQVLEQFGAITLLSLRLHTGRTHQIRVHCAAIGHPIVGDPVYGGRKLAKVNLRRADLLSGVSRQMLHARRLEFFHPTTHQPMVFEAPLPDDMQALIDALRRSRE